MKKLLIPSALALFAAIVGLMPLKPRESSAGPSQHPEAALPAKASRIARDRLPAPTPPVSAPTPPVSAPAMRDAARAAIDAAVVTYQPAGVRAIRPFLLDPDAEVRQAARDGLVQLGESDAIPFLREAAGKLEDPSEIESLHRAADLLALPAWSDTAEAREAVAEIVEGDPR